MEKIGIGLDFGNSNTTLALAYDNEVHYVKIDHYQEDGTVMPSALYLDRDYDIATGFEALSRYLADNTNRRIRLTRVHVGTIDVHMGEMDRDYFIDRDRSFTAQLHAKVDKDLPGRLFRGLKAYLGGEEHHRFKVFDKSFRLEALLNLLLKSIKESADKENIEIKSLHVGRPVIYEGSQKGKTSFAQERMAKALTRAGFPEPQFMMEPVGAAWSYQHEHAILSHERILVFDFGGGTLDLALLEQENGALHVKRTAGLAQAGDWIDRALFSRMVFPLLGKGSEVHRRRDDGTFVAYPFPFSDYEELLLSWQSTYLLKQPQYLEEIDKAAREGGELGIKMRRLGKLIRCNGSFLLLKLIEQVKKDLTSKTETSLHFPEADIDIVVTREDLEETISSLIEKIPALVKEALGPLPAEKVDRIVCAGGSSLIPKVQNTLESIFPGKIEEWDPFKSIASGLALADLSSQAKRLD